MRLMRLSLRRCLRSTVEKAAGLQMALDLCGYRFSYQTSYFIRRMRSYDARRRVLCCGR